MNHSGLIMMEHLEREEDAYGRKIQFELVHPEKVISSQKMMRT